MMGPADRAAAATGVDEPYEWSPVQVELRTMPRGAGVVLVVFDGAGVEVGRAAITPSMVAAFSGKPSTTKIRLIREAAE